MVPWCWSEAPDKIASIHNHNIVFPAIFLFRPMPVESALSSIAEHYNCRMAEAFEGLSGFRRVVDDVVIFDKDKVSHVEHVRQFIQQCNDRKIALNKDKWKYCQSKVTFAGFTLSSEGYQVDAAITEAISEFPTPSDHTELRSFCGLVNQLASGTNRIAELMSPLRPLLSTKNEFVWSADHALAFSKVKEQLVTSPVLAFFDLKNPHDCALMPAGKDWALCCSSSPPQVNGP